MHSKHQLSTMKAEHQDWQNRLSFYKDEISSFNEHLIKVVETAPVKRIMPNVEHFQNQFIRQREVIDIIHHDFKQHENLIENLETEKAKEPRDGIVKIHSHERDKLDQFERVFQDLRNEFNSFLSDVKV
jgi:uncharacterized coiled-coil DUF342 family protein